MGFGEGVGGIYSTMSPSGTIQNCSGGFLKVGKPISGNVNNTRIGIEIRANCDFRIVHVDNVNVGVISMNGRQTFCVSSETRNNLKAVSRHIENNFVTEEVRTNTISVIRNGIIGEETTKVGLAKEKKGMEMTDSVPYILDG